MWASHNNYDYVACLDCVLPRDGTRGGLSSLPPLSAATCGDVKIHAKLASSSGCTPWIFLHGCQHWLATFFVPRGASGSCIPPLMLAYWQWLPSTYLDSEQFALPSLWEDNFCRSTRLAVTDKVMGKLISLLWLE
jgi:hypothetical protein